MKQEYKTKIDASKISHHQKTAEQQKAIAAIIAKKKTQLKTAENTAMGYHEMLQEISKEVADAHCCARDHQEKLSKTEMLATKRLEKVRDIEGKVTLLQDKLAEQYVNATAIRTNIHELGDTILEQQAIIRLRIKNA